MVVLPYAHECGVSLSQLIFKHIGEFFFLLMLMGSQFYFSYVMHGGINIKYLMQ